MKVLLLGSSGQLGCKIKETSPCWAEIVTFSRSELDLTSIDSINKIFQDHYFDVVINCAAYTQVDQAELEPQNAYLLNAQAVAQLAKHCYLNKSFLLHYSTDYVFDGYGHEPYNEEALASPTSIYGNTKLMGERAIIESGCNFVIIRTSWLYSEIGKNFFLTILKKIKSNHPLRVVDDQVGSPTYTLDLANVTWNILGRGADFLKMKEVFHFSNEGLTTWFEFALEISRLLGKESLVTPVKTSDYKTLATRPQYSALDKTKIKKILGLEIQNWKTSLENCFEKYRELEKYD